MNVVDTALAQAKQVIGKVTEKVTDAATAESHIQAITIGKPRREVIDLFRDPVGLSQVFGDIADVHEAGVDRLRWAFFGDGPAWDCVVSLEDESRLRYVDVDPEKDIGVTLLFRDAPQDRGTEVIGKASAPAPGALTGLVIYKALYRARALLQTGEVPTIKHNPSARDSQR
ncbi:hypothetical protein SAMN04489835_0321 [Mycolicibacterium rutilum]|uniref:Polyketide cyclase / dehydrase and lipid transport n=1 Tax=Mycolicibacterium rutilum TaxID=370526 RepID=A0A1H6IPI3_MYCRU|nr:hypothetical protein [Mycolicibacterium rutilum]SEH48200.1 hypothetical protein SAMN04489835_0321 [Mycolicibacterium rutilum]